MHCCRCDLRLDIGVTYVFKDDHFCLPCLLTDALWNKEFEERVEELRANLCSPVIRAKLTSVDAIAKLKARVLKIHKLEEVDGRRRH